MEHCHLNPFNLTYLNIVFSPSNMVIFHSKVWKCQWTVLCPRLSGTPLQNDLEDRGESPLQSLVALVLGFFSFLIDRDIMGFSGNSWDFMGIMLWIWWDINYVVGMYGGILMGYYSQLICGITGMMVLLAVIGGNYPKANSEEVSEVLQFLSRWLL